MSRHQRFWSFTRNTFCRALGRRYDVIECPDNHPVPAPPFIVVSNHGNFFDPWLLGRYQKKALHIMMNDDGFRSGAFTRWYLKAIGAFAKKKGAQDIKAMKNTLTFLKASEPVLIFPEGQATWDGETQPIYGGIERMVKRAKCALVLVRMKGHFLTRPWWATGSRKGRIELKRTVYSPEQLAQMSNEEVLQLILDGIYNNDILDEDNLAVAFRGKNLAQGAHRLLWQCVHCEADDTLSTAGDEIICGACGGRWRANGHLHLQAQEGFAGPVGNVHAWHQHNKQSALEKIRATGDGDVLCRNDGITLFAQGPDGDFESRGDGVLTLSARTLRFEPSLQGQPMDFALDGLVNFVIQKKEVFEITVDGKDYRFDMNGRSPMKWLVFVRYLRGWKEIEEKRVI